MSLLTLLGCLGGSPSKVMGDLPATFTATVVDVPGGTVFGFDGGPFVPLPERRLAAFRLTSSGATPVGPSGAGWYRAVATAGGESWAVIATPREDKNGSHYRLVVGLGESWEERGPIPATSLTHVATAGGAVGWAVGVRQLWRTADGGASWQAVDGVLPSGGSTECVAVAGRRVVVGAGGLVASEDAGETWTKIDDAPVLACDTAWVAARDGRVGRIERGGVTWVSTVPEGWLAHGLWSDAGGVWIRATRNGQVGVFEGAAAGGGLRLHRIPGVGDPDWVGLGAPLTWMDLGRQVRRRGG